MDYLLIINFVFVNVHIFTGYLNKIIFFKKYISLYYLIRLSVYKYSCFCRK